MVGDVGVIRSGVAGALVTRGSTPSSTAVWSCLECILSCFFQLLASLKALPQTLQPYGFSPRKESEDAAHFLLNCLYHTANKFTEPCVIECCLPKKQCNHKVSHQENILTMQYIFN